MATYMGRDTSKLKAKGGKWKYMSEAEMLSIASGFSPYRCVHLRCRCVCSGSCYAGGLAGGHPHTDDAIQVALHVVYVENRGRGLERHGYDLSRARM